jgi:hypothetical protein
MTLNCIVEHRSELKINSSLRDYIIGCSGPLPISSSCKEFRRDNSSDQTSVIPIVLSQVSDILGKHRNRRQITIVKPPRLEDARNVC